MGLDQYLLLERPNKKTKSVLGIMNGYFPLGIESDKQQIGYWRKAYEVSDLILNIVDWDFKEDHNCVDLPLTKENIMAIITYAEKELNNYPDNEDEDIWRYTLTIFKEALNIISTEPDCTIYYKEWF